MTVICLGAEMAINIFLPLRYSPLSGVISILVIGEGCVRNFSMQRDIFKVINKPHIYPRAFLFNLIVAIISMSFSAKFGLLYFCLVKILNDLLYCIIQIIIIRDIKLFSFFDFWRVSKFALFSSSIMAFSWLFIENLISIESRIFQFMFLFFLLIISLIIFIGTYHRLDKRMLNEIYLDAKTALNK